MTDSNSGHAAFFHVIRFHSRSLYDTMPTVTENSYRAAGYPLCH